MKAKDIQEGKTYQNVQGMYRRVESLVEDPNLPGPRNAMVSWTLTKDANPDRARGKTPLASGTCRMFDFCGWAAGEAGTMPVQDDKKEMVRCDNRGQTVMPEAGDLAFMPDTSNTPLTELFLQPEPPPRLEGAVYPGEAGPLPTVVTAPMAPKDMYASFSVLLTREMKGADLEALLTAIKQLRGVASVTPVRADMQYFIAKDQARREILGQIKEVLKG